MRSAWALPCWWRSSCCWESSWWIRLRRLELSLSELRSYKCTPRQWVHSEHLSVISLNHFLRPAIVFLQGCKWCPWKKWQLYQLINAHCPMLKHTNTHQQKKNHPFVQPRHRAFSTSWLPGNSAEEDLMAIATVNLRLPKVSRILHNVFWVHVVEEC